MISEVFKIQLGGWNVETYAIAISIVREVSADFAVGEAVEGGHAAGGVGSALALHSASILIADTLLEVVGSDGVRGGGHSVGSWNWVGQDGREHGGGREGGDDELDEGHFDGCCV